jgi:hypothetical protein
MPIFSCPSTPQGCDTGAWTWWSYFK